MSDSLKDSWGKMCLVIESVSIMTQGKEYSLPASNSLPCLNFAAMPPKSEDP